MPTPLQRSVLLAAFLVAATGLAQTPAERLASRTFPSVFMAWSPAEHASDVDKRDNYARHALMFSGPASFGLHWNDAHYQGAAESFTTQSIVRALAFRADLLQRNPNMILLAEIRYRDAREDFLPADSPWWMRDGERKKKPGWDEGGYYLLDFRNPDFRAHIARQAAAAVKSGVVDGVMFDWWHERPKEDADARVELIKAVREAIGPDTLIIVNSNHERIDRSAPYVNGIFMECYKTKTPDDWKTIGDTLRWAEANLRAPHINCCETWYAESRGDLNRMRATTTLALTMSDGFCLFSDPNPLPTPDHLHDWYDFWNRGLGRPKAAGAEQPDRTWRREFDNGFVVYNPFGNKAVTVKFEQPAKSRATGNVGSQHEVPAGDGDIFMRE